MAQKMQAKWNGEVLAESDQTVVVEGNHYFPAESVTATLLPSETTSTCAWKGTSSYYSIEAGGETYFVRGKVVLDPGYAGIYTYARSSDEEIPALEAKATSLLVVSW